MLVHYIYYVNQRDSLFNHKNCKSFEVFLKKKHSNDKKRNLDLQVIEPMTSTYVKHTIFIYRYSLF
jgi:hypothetical protein